MPEIFIRRWETFVSGRWVGTGSIGGSFFAPCWTLFVNSALYIVLASHLPLSECKHSSGCTGGGLSHSLELLLPCLDQLEPGAAAGLVLNPVKSMFSFGKSVLSSIYTQRHYRTMSLYNYSLPSVIWTTQLSIIVVKRCRLIFFSLKTSVLKSNFKISGELVLVV